MRSIVSTSASSLSEMGVPWGGVMWSGFFDHILQFKNRQKWEGGVRMEAVKPTVRAF